MKQVIDGKIYDTGDAEQVARSQNTADRRDLSYLRETLYKTGNGAYFLAGEGGAQTKYAKSVAGGSLSGGQQLREMSDSTAFEWCQESQIEAEVILDEFPERVEKA